MDSTSDIGQATFRPATVRNLFRAARSPTPFFRVFRRLRIWRESTARLMSIPIWRLSFGLDPALPKPAQSVGFEQGTTASEHRLAVCALGGFATR